MTNVLIVSQAKIHRNGFNSLLQNANGINVVGGCRGEEASDQARTKKPDVVLLDVKSHSEHPIIESILGSWPRSKIIVVGVENRDQDILFWMEHGASHFVTADAGQN